MPSSPRFIAAIKVHFGQLPDPRVERTKLHPLMDILVIALCGVLTGSVGWDGLEMFGKARRKWLKEFLELPNGIPSADTFRRVFSAIEPRAFETCFRSLIRSIAQAVKGEVIAVDGKSLKGAIRHAGSTTPLHIVHVWAAEQRLLLGQKAVPGAPGEVAGLLEILDSGLMDIEGAIVTTDANSCTSEVASAIRRKGAHYLLALKGNRARQYAYVQGLFETAAANGYAGLGVHVSRSKGHGRIETRTVRTMQLTDWPSRSTWADIKTAVMVERVREVKGERSSEQHFYITSFPRKPKRLAHAIRAHWSVENHLHWTLDVAFGEDRMHLYDENAVENVAILTRLALLLLKSEKTQKRGINSKRQLAALDPEYLVRVLQTGITPN